MMYNYPMWGFPWFRRNYYPNSNFYKYSNYRPNTTTNNTYTNQHSVNNNLANDKKISNNSNNFNYTNSDNECFNIFGLSLHNDDLLILALIFFLYKEGTDDIYLYIILFLLLFS